MVVRAFTVLAAVLGLFGTAFAQPRSAEPSLILFENVRVFDGKSGSLSANTNVLIRGNTIEKISKDPIPVNLSASDKRIVGGGRTLMPGLIDMHWHAMMVRPTLPALLTGDIGHLNLMAGAEATDTLMRGFTTVRDVGGPVFGLKRAIDEGIVTGPRIYPSGAVITVTSGHGDFRQPFEVPRALGATQSRGEQLGAAMIADSPDEVRVRVREQLMLGATQIKLTAGGGVASPHSPLDASTFTEAELRAAVEAAENWGTYVTVHAYTSVSIQRAIAAGVKCIEHGHLMDQRTAELMAEKGIWLSTQAFPDELANAFPPGSLESIKARVVFAGTDRTFELAKKHKIKTAFGTDILFSPQLAQRHGTLLAKLVRWYTPAEALVMATGTNAELLGLSGERNPYPGKLGVVEEGALADLLLVDGDPTANITLIEDPAKNFVVIVKDGKVYKNTL
ncbi:amidohydrolase family protein [Reyranella sp.]|uniref:metal-dependent hydrolase family protein n=1 Tax=Reyranella sp. TaxID=1929291 RepID=UPI0012035136|nr:amidohydrolase family protein [Reyranella sp.]TAJ87564.1 MAG: amidohydrolase family protein [Reyranella sp.]